MHRWTLLVLAVGLALLPAAGARAQMIPLADVRENSADATAFGITDAQFHYPPAPFAYWEDNASAHVDNPDPEGSGFTDAGAYSISEFFPAGINASGGTGGSWQIVPGQYSALSYVNFKFRVDTCFDYKMDAWFTPGDLGSSPDSRVALGASGTNVDYQSTTSEIHQTGRLPAGTYELEGKSYIISDQENASGPVYSIIWTCTPCTATLIRSHPPDRTVACGGTATFSVAPTTPVPSGLTYQWRKNLAPLANGGNLGGVTTPTLTISSACTSDEGYYDVVLSNGTIVEPSRLAHLVVITGVTGVDETETGQRLFSFESAGPNPFSAKTSFRYTATRPQYARIAIYTVAGSLVRSLVDGTVSGVGTVTWDGTTRAGSRAPAGIYFMRVDAGSNRETRKVVLLR